MENSTSRKLIIFLATRFVYIPIKSLKKASTLLNILRYWDLKQTWKSYEQKYGSTNNPWQSILQQQKKILQNWAGPENFDICFCVNLDSYCQKTIFEGEADH